MVQTENPPVPNNVPEEMPAPVVENEPVTVEEQPVVYENESVEYNAVEPIEPVELPPEDAVTPSTDPMLDSFASAPVETPAVQQPVNSYVQPELMGSFSVAAPPEASYGVVAPVEPSPLSQPRDRITFARVFNIFIGCLSVLFAGAIALSGLYLPEDATEFTDTINALPLGGIFAVVAVIGVVALVFPRFKWLRCVASILMWLSHFLVFTGLFLMLGGKSNFDFASLFDIGSGTVNPGQLIVWYFLAALIITGIALIPAMFSTRLKPFSIAMNGILIGNLMFLAVTIIATLIAYDNILTQFRLGHSDVAITVCVFALVIMLLFVFFNSMIIYNTAYTDKKATAEE
ncbi:MAG: hypothetical protein MJ132_03775 [Clostridia bacterium]|nr:hypothetical protein [Clostridia bacterium]